jgi:hypothetical protein
MNLRMAKTSAANRVEPEGLPSRGHPTVAQRKQMERDGYLVVRHFFGADQVADLLRWTTELETAAEEPGRHWVYREDSLTEPGRRVIQRIENFSPFHGRLDLLVLPLR